MHHEKPSGAKSDRAGWIAAGLIALAAAAHYPSLNGGFLWDDYMLIVGNALIHSPTGLYDFWFTTNAHDYFPMTYTLWWLEWRLWAGSEHPMGYHVINLALHALGSVLLWRVLLRLRAPAAALAAALFAVHPVTVASVAWISEGKNTLSFVLAMTAFLSYLRFEDERRRRWYITAIVAFLLALLAKSSVVMLPVMILLCALWRRRQITWRDIRLTAPLFALSAVLGMVTVWFQYGRDIGTLTMPAQGAASRIAGVAWIVWFYLYKAFAPVGLCYIYPRWQIDPANIVAWIPLAALAAALILCWRHRRGWGWSSGLALGGFVLALAPVLGLIRTYFMTYTLVADHWQYLALPVVTATVAAAAARLAASHPGTARGAAVAAVALFAALTWQRSNVFAGEQSVWQDTVDKNPGAWVAYNNLGAILARQGKLDRAAEHFRRVIDLRDDHLNARTNLGKVLQQQGRPDQAVQWHEQALELDPDSLRARINLADSLLALRREQQAIEHYRIALKLQPNLTNAHQGIARAHYRLGERRSDAGDHQGAMQHWRRALHVAQRAATITQSMDPAVLEVLAAALAANGQFDQAAATARRALTLIDPAHGPLAGRLRSCIVMYDQGQRSALDMPATP